jgi:hypothetical protein
MGSCRAGAGGKEEPTPGRRVAQSHAPPEVPLAKAAVSDVDGTPTGPADRHADRGRPAPAPA